MVSMKTSESLRCSAPRRSASPARTVLISGTRPGLRIVSARQAARIPARFRIKSGRGCWIWRTWFRRSRACLYFGRAHHVGNSDLRANFEIGRTFCRGRIDINFKFLRALLHCHHAAGGGYHRPSDLISLRPGGECYPAEDQIRYCNQAKCRFHFHAVNYEPPKARRKVLEDVAEPSEAGQLLQFILSKLNRSLNRTKRSWATQPIGCLRREAGSIFVPRAHARFSDLTM